MILYRIVRKPYIDSAAVSAVWLMICPLIEYFSVSDTDILGEGNPNSSSSSGLLLRVFGFPITSSEVLPLTYVLALRPLNYVLVSCSSVVGHPEWYSENSSWENPISFLWLCLCRWLTIFYSPGLKHNIVFISQFSFCSPYWWTLGSLVRMALLQ